MHDITPRKIVATLIAALGFVGGLTILLFLSSYLTGGGHAGRTLPKNAEDFATACPQATPAEINKFFEAWAAQWRGDSETAKRIYRELEELHPGCSVITANMNLFR